MALLRGVDVSHHNPPATLDYAVLARTHRFLIARATYGVQPDGSCAEHLKRARDVGLLTGLYHFYRPGQPVTAQLAAFAEVAERVGMGPGWLLPALDVEKSPAFDGPATPARYAPAEALAEAWRADWGGALIYTNPSTWTDLGSPSWLQHFPLWIAHYGVKEPRPPFGMPWAIWQHASEPLEGAAGDIDQNVARGLPLIKTPPEPKLLPLEPDWDEWRRERDRVVRETDEE